VAPVHEILIASALVGLALTAYVFWPNFNLPATWVVPMELGLGFFWAAWGLLVILQIALYLIVRRKKPSANSGRQID
jgi:membrane protein implicated in regulation of membrane protease activity